MGGYLNMEYEFIKGFLAAVEDCRLFGRGTYDMGIGIAIQVEWEEWESGKYIMRAYLLENGVSKIDFPIGETLCDE
jgi:hypothetical protein